MHHCQLPSLLRSAYTQNIQLSTPQQQRHKLLQKQTPQENSITSGKSTARYIASVTTGERLSSMLFACFFL